MSRTCSGSGAPIGDQCSASIPDSASGNEITKTMNLLERTSGQLLGDLEADDWKELPHPFVIDSGAAETVLPTEWCSNYPIRESAGQRAGQFYTAAIGVVIHNRGEKTLLLSSMDGNDLDHSTSECRPSLSVTSAKDMASGASCLLAKTSKTASRRFSSESKSWSASCASLIASLSVESTTKIRP